VFGDLEAGIESHLQSKQSKILYSLLSFLFLTADIILPVPSSLVMILNGKELGFLYGSILSLMSGLSSSLIGFYLGRAAKKYVNRWFTNYELQKSEFLFYKYGRVSIIVSKALPILSEAVSVFSGTTGISFKLFLMFSLIGQLVVSCAYAYIGSFMSSANSIVASTIIIVSVSLTGWLAQKLIKPGFIPD
jgi:uncharacterized membrane protein YdjX (TVP38/TMEM64 family)